MPNEALTIIACGLALVAISCFTLWRSEVAGRKFWKEERDREFVRNADLHEGLDNLRRANGRLQGKLKFLREALGEDDTPTP